MNISIADELHARGRHARYKRAYLGGTFDCLHRGHLALFAAARKIAETIIVSVNTDEFAAKYKRWPLMPLADRLAVLSQIRIVDRVIVNVGGADSTTAIERAKPDCIVHGSDWSGPSLLQQMGLSDEWIAERGIDLVVLPYTPIVNTTELLTEHRKREALAVV